jgi:hypothetical protein
LIHGITRIDVCKILIIHGLMVKILFLNGLGPAFWLGLLVYFSTVSSLLNGVELIGSGWGMRGWSFKGLFCFVYGVGVWFLGFVGLDKLTDGIRTGWVRVTFPPFAMRLRRMGHPGFCGWWEENRQWGLFNAKIGVDASTFRCR